MVHRKALWKKTAALIIRRRNKYWCPKYVIAVCGTSELQNKDGSNAAEQNHRTIQWRNPHIKDMTIGIEKFIDQELSIRFDCNWTKLINLIEKDKQQIQYQQNYDNINDEEEKKISINDCNINNEEEKMKKPKDLKQKEPKLNEQELNELKQHLEWLEALFEQLQLIYSLKSITTDIFGHGIIQFDASQKREDYLGGFDYKRCIVGSTRMKKSDENWIVLWISSHINEYNELLITEELLTELNKSLHDKYDNKTLRKYLEKKYKIIKNNM